MSAPLATLPLDAAARAESEAPPVRFRLATDADGPAIGALYRIAGLNDLGVDWMTADVAGWWIVAERETELVGAIQVCASRPFGFIGDVAVHPSAKGRGDDGRGRLSKRPGAVGFALYVLALRSLEAAGSQFAVGVTDKPALKTILTSHGGVNLGTFDLFAKRLR